MFVQNEQRLLIDINGNITCERVIKLRKRVIKTNGCLIDATFHET
jgi:hypothetical protein